MISQVDTRVLTQYTANEPFKMLLSTFIEAITIIFIGLSMTKIIAVLNVSLDTLKIWFVINNNDNNTDLFLAE